MPAKGKGKWQKQNLAKARRRYHDYNSTRRHRGQSTVSFTKYRRQIQGKSP